MNIDRDKADYTLEDVAAVRQQFNDYKKAEEASWQDLCDRIGSAAPSTLSAFAMGKYQGDNRKLAWTINRFFVAEEARQAQALMMPITPGFRMTRTAEKITAQLRWAHQGEVVVVVGNPGLSKTSTVDRYCATTPNAFKATMSAATRAPGPMLAEIARSTGRVIKNRSNMNMVYQELVQRLDGLRALLVIDEAQHLSDAALDQVRALHDRTGCGLALVGNHTVLGRIQAGVRSPEFAQIHSRVSWPQTYLTPEPQDVEILCDAWEVPPGQQREFLAKVASLPGGVRSLTQTLKMATLAARSTEEDRCLSHLKAAWTQLSRQPVSA